MKESKFQNTNSLDYLKNKVWKLFDLLRGESIRTNEYSVILYLLILHKEIGLEKTLESRPEYILSSIQELIESKENINHETLVKLSYIFMPTIEQISNYGILDMIRLLTSLNFDLLKKHIGEIYDEVIYKLSEIQGKLSGEFLQPLELSQFVCELVDLDKNAKIYNPFAGAASFNIFFDHKVNYLGQEINQKTWALGTMRMMAYEKSGRLDLGDSIRHWNPSDEQYDLIVAHPPFRMRLHDNIPGKFGTIKTAEQFLIEKGIEDLTPDGSLIVILPKTFVFRAGYEEQLRRYLVDQDLLDMVISFPAGLLPHTGIPFNVLVISKKKEYEGVVRFIDAKRFIESLSNGKRRINYYDLNSVVANNKEGESLRFTSIEEIHESNYILHVARYLIKDYKGVPLENLITKIKGEKKFGETEGKYVRIRDLSNDKLNAILDLQNIESEKIHKNAKKINQSCLLVASRWKTLKPTYFHYKNEPIFISQDIMAFTVDDSKVDPYFLINELHAAYIQEQLEGYRLGTTIPYVKKADFLKVKVNIPSLKEQKEKALKGISSKLESLKEFRNKFTHDTEKKQFDEFADLKHTLGRPRQNILDWTDNLLDFFSTNHEGYEQLNKSFNEFYETDILSVLNEIKRDINFITDVLEKGEQGFVIENYKKGIISLNEVYDIIKNISDNNYNFKITKHLIKSEQIKNKGIEINKNLFKTLFDNILKNAHNHGFDKKNYGNEVFIKVTEIDDFLTIEISNNGKPFPKNFDKKKLITKYRTSDKNNGTGFGGYDINRIATYFNNPEWDLLLNEDPIYPVKFKFQFPIKMIN